MLVLGGEIFDELKSVAIRWARRVYALLFQAFWARRIEFSKIVGILRCLA